MTSEQALFDGYRRTDGYVAECACGVEIRLRFGTELAVGEAVRDHNASTIHRQWSEWQEAVHALQRPTRRQCPCHWHPEPDSTAAALRKHIDAVVAVLDTTELEP